MTGSFAVLFDLDGTLIDLNPEPLELEELRVKTLEHAVQAGITPKSKSIYGTYQQAANEIGFASVAAHNIRKLFDAYEVEWVRSRATVKVNSQELGSLKQRNYLITIVTNNGRACLNSLLSLEKLNSEYVDFAVTRDDTPLLKPSSLPIEIACRNIFQNAITRTKIWFVGDSASDELACQEFRNTTAIDLEFIRVGTEARKSPNCIGYPDVNAAIRHLTIESDALIRE